MTVRRFPFAQIGHGGDGSDPAIPECPVCYARGGGGHGGFCPNMSDTLEPLPPDQWVTEPPPGLDRPEREWRP